MSINVTVVGATGISTVITNNETVDVAVGTAFQAQVPSLMVEAGANITVTTTSGSFTIIGRDVPVQSVQGRSGNVVVTRTDLTAAAAVHSHIASDISNLTSVANVVSVQGRTGAVTVTRADLTAAASTHTHLAADISNLTSVANVVSVQGRTGVVSLATADVSAASATHAHNYVQALNAQTGSLSIVAGSNVTVTTAAGSITIASGGGGGIGNVTSVAGRTGTVVLTVSDISNITSVANVVSVQGRTGVVSLNASDVSAASSAHAHEYVQSLNARTGSLSIVAGSNVTVTTAGSSITIAAAGENSLSIGTVTSGAAASATIIGSAPSQVLNLVLPRGDTGSVGATGPANALSIGTVTSGTAASAAITGSAPSQTLSLVLPKGDRGDTGATGTFGTPQDINAVTASYTLVLGDAGKLVTVSSSSSATVTVPANASVAFPVGTHIDIARLGVGAVTVDGDAGVTVNSTPGRRLRAAYSTGTLIKLGTNTWLLVGDLAT